MRWVLVAGLVLLSACSRVTNLLPGSSTAQSVATPDLTDAERIALARGRSASCRFVHGFAEARNAVPEVIGECTENERSDPATGDTLQRTNRGLLVWRKADGLIAFTDGHRTWVRGPDGLMRVRANDERFAWEAAPAGPNAPVLRIVTPGPPVPTAAPTPPPGATPPSDATLGATPGAVATTVGGSAPTKPAVVPPGATKPPIGSEPPKPLPIAATPAPAKP